MLKVITLTAIGALALAAVSQPALARDHSGAIVAGVIGAVAVGAIVASQSDRGYYGGPGYYEQSGYNGGYYGGCHIERQWVGDRYGHRHLRRIRVCD